MEPQTAQAARTPQAKRIATPKPAKGADAKAVLKAKAEVDAKRAAATAAKAKADADKAKAREKAETKLELTAKEILVRLEKATMMDGKADDHRLAAALKFAEAKTICDEVGIKFEEWSKKHVPNQSFETVRQLARIGAADDPKLALADLRKGNAERNKKARKAKKAAGRTGGDLPTAPSRPTTTPFQRAEAALAEVPEKVLPELLKSQAGQLGYQVVSDKELKELRAVKGAATSTSKEGDGLTLTADEIVGAFKKLKAGDRIKVLDQMEHLTGYVMVDAEDHKLLKAAKKAGFDPSKKAAE